MSKKNKPKSFGLDPQFKKDTKERYGHPVDLSDMPDEMKMSAKLIALAEPFHEGELDQPTLYDCATIAWNECVQEDHNKRTDYVLNNALLNFTNYRDMIDILKARKRRLFPDDVRGIKEVAVIYKRNGDYSVNVVSDMNLEFMAKVMAEKLKKYK